MIEYDYQLDKSNGESIDHFTPSFDKKISNVSKFKGHNSSGKTTLMDMIALSMYGDDSPDVLKKLQDKLKHLKTANNSEFTFNLSANTGNKHLRITTKKEGYISGNPNWISKIEESSDGVNYQSLIKETFRKKYRLIYDMPDRPMERIQELVSEAERELRSDIDNLTSIRSPLTNIISSVESSRNEDLISLLKQQISKLEDTISEKQSEYDDSTSLLKSIQEYYYAANLKYEQENYNKINTMLINLDSADKKKRSEQKKSIKKYENEEKYVRTNIKLMLSSYNDVLKNIGNISKVDSKIIEKYSHYWDNHDHEKIFNMGCSEIYVFTKISTELSNQIIEKYNETGSQILIDKKKMLQSLISVLEPHIQDKMSVLDSNVSEIYNRLKAELDSLSIQIDEYEMAMAVDRSVKDSKEHGKSADKFYNELGEKPELDDTDEEMRSKLVDRLNTANESLKKAEKDADLRGVSFDNYYVIIDKFYSNLEFSKYVAMDLEDLLSFQNDLEARTNKQKEILDGLNRSLDNQKSQLQDAQLKESHPLYDYLIELKELKNKIEKTIPTLTKKDSMLIELSRGNEVKEDESNKVFLDSVWVYLGKKLDTIQHIGKKYKVDKIDMNLREVISGNVHINFRDMGTGESQMAYLTGLLNTDDSRTIIALFDEVDHMDPIVISKIQDRMKELLDSGKLIIGLMAAPGNNTEVEQYE